MPHTKQRKQRTILCVDDNVALVDNLREIFEETGYLVRGATSCAEALKVAHDGFDVALVDLRLPDRDGTLALNLVFVIARDSYSM